MHRFFADPFQIKGDKIVITGDDVNHISRVLRLKSGDEIEVCDKNKTDYLCTVLQISKTEVLAGIVKSYPNKNESDVELTLYQGIPKGDKMDDIVRKCVELGVKKIVPVNMKRTVVKVKAPFPKTQRWERISLEASKQCKRGIIPQILDPVSFDEMADAVLKEDALNILPYENEDTVSLKTVLKSNSSFKKVNLIIGPEGGFDDDEVNRARKNGIHTVTLGPRIMRCETAPVAAVSAVMYELGDW